MNEQDFSYIYSLSVFYCNELEEMNNMENLDIEDLDSSVWVLALVEFLLTHCCVEEKHNEEEVTE